MTETTDPYVLSPEEGAKILTGAPWRRFGVFGDSLSLGVGDATPGYDDLGRSARVERVLRRVHPDLAYINTAKVGATTARRKPDWGRIEEDLRAMYEWATSTGAHLSVFTLGRASWSRRFPTSATASPASTASRTRWRQSATRPSSTAGITR